LTSEPFERPTADFWPDKEDQPESEHAISFKYTNILHKPLLRSELVSHPVLKDLQIIRSAQGRNFKVTPEQWEAIRELTEDDKGPTIEDLAARSYMDVAELRELEDLLLDKGQIILEGPPGSGKTYIADLLARYLTGNPLSGEHDQHVQIIQFHQSYGYEDFVQGIRPKTDESGGLQYRVVPGIFMRMSAIARANPDQRFVLVIDEINRGNVSRIFGELMLLLEYREKSIRLPYGAGEGTDPDGDFSIPDNLYLIGTMNSTDRSLALIDYALRRRFYFYQLLPTQDGGAPVLERWLAQRTIDATVRQHRLNLFVTLNSRIKDQLSPDFQVGHSYFMTDDIHTGTGLDRVWKRAIMPLLTEYFHNSRDQGQLLAGYQHEILAPEIASEPITNGDE
jgi:5-methylcytosine-specific restriction protein B